MTYNDYYKLRERLKADLEKLYRQYKTVDDCYDKTQMSSVLVEREHIQALINNLEEAVNNLEYFTNE